MKRILLAFAIASVSLAAFTGCTKEYYTNSSAITYDPVIQPNKWIPLSSGSSIYQAQLDFPEISNKIVDDGSLTVALMFTGENGFLGSYDAIPATINGVHYSYNYTSGRITIYAEVRTNDTDLDIDYPIKAKITIADAEYGGN